MRYIFGIFAFVFTFTSCGTMRSFKTSDFSTINCVKSIEGNYLNRNSDRISILSRFNIGEEANFVTITAENPNEIKLAYHNDSSIRQERVFAGEMKQNYFEIYFSNQKKVIPLIYGNFNIDRIRMGKTKDGKLLIRKFVDNSGHLLFFAGGYSVETPYIFSYANELNDYTPIHENGLWGFSDSLGNIVIPKIYDFVSSFDKGVARVKLNNKWGLINRQGEEIAPIKYDKLSLIDTVFSPPIIRAYIGEKVGILDLSGNETIPVIYDFIAYSNMGYYGLFSIRLGDKKGFASRTQVVIPAIYSEISPLGLATATAKRDGRYFIVDRDGYEYEAKGSVFWGMRAKPDTKRKIKFEEQRIE